MYNNIIFYFKLLLKGVKMKFILILLSLSVFHLCASTETLSQNKLIEEKLKKSIENVKKFKRKKNNEIRKLTAEIAQLKLSIKKLNRKYRQCQISKKKRINKLTESLNISENNFYLLYDENQKIKEALLKKNPKVPKTQPFQPFEQQTTEHDIGNEANIIEPISIKHDWVEVLVEDNINIYELALQYYGKKSEYTEIYRANKDVIPKTLKLVNGMSLKLPVTHNFKERPIILNHN